LTAYRYPAMGDDCRDLALEYLAFALRYMPQLDKMEMPTVDAVAKPHR
jgi:hypothetical protein